MDFTSERVSPQQYQNNLEDYLIFITHEGNYRHVLNACQDKKVLDCGCGDGYGASILSSLAGSVNAVDVSEKSIEEAKRKYVTKNLTFETILPIEEKVLPFSDNTFDVIVSFQVIEHVLDDTSYLADIHRVLKPGGRFCCSTPNAKVRLLSFQNPWNKFHVREYTPDSFREKLDQVFRNTELYGLGLSEPWGKLEKKRFHTNKWVLWPVTNKFIPDPLRVFLLSGIWKLMQSFRKNKTSGGALVSKPELSDVLVTKTDVATYASLYAECQKELE